MPSIRIRARDPRRLLAASAVAALLLGLAPGPAPANGPADPTRPAGPPTGSDGSVGSTDRGTWRVVDLGDGRHEVSWTSPVLLPLGSDRPTITGVGDGAGLDLGTPSLDADGRTVRALVTSATTPLAADLDVLLSGDRLDEPGLDPLAGQPAAPGAAPRTTVLPGVDPGVAGSFATVTSDYTLDPVKVAGMPRPIEMVGHVVEPAAAAATGPRPLVVFLHGRHGVCFDPDDDDAFSGRWPCRAPFEEIPSHLGYDYVQRLLASQGYATVSVRVNGINAQDYRLDDGGADARATIVEEHLDHWVDLAPAHRVDLDQVVLVGHSRGGEGVSRASIQIPVGAPYRIAGQVLLAPTDFASHTASYVPTATVLPYCDGDVSDIQGQKFTDTGRDLTRDDTSLKSSVLVMGANHNFFNTEWTPATAVAPSFDDWYGAKDEPCGRATPERLSAAEQRRVGKAYVAGAVALFTGDDATLPLLDGSAVVPASIGDADVRTHAIGGGRDLRRPGIEATPTAPAGGAETRLCAGTLTRDSGAFAVCGRSVRDQITPHWTSEGEMAPTRSFFEMGWTSPGAVGGLRFDDPLDLSADRLELRTLVDARRGDVRLRIRVTDAAGGSVVLTPEGGEVLRPLLRAPYLTKLWAQPVLVDVAGASGVDTAAISSVELLGRSRRGRVWVADLAAAPTTLAAVPATRLPTVDVGELRQVEGGPGPRVARVPFTVTGEVTRPARLLVVTTGQQVGTRHRFVVDVAPGQTSGSIPVGYTGDRRDDLDAQTQIAVWPLSGIATDDYLGRLDLVDDDPAPQVALAPTSRTVREGDTITFQVTLSDPVDYDLFTYGRVLDGPGEDLRGTDVRRSWLEKHGDAQRPRRPLHEVYVDLSTLLRQGRRTDQVVLPTARDGVREGRESLTVRFDVAGRSFTRTVRVLDAG